MGSSRGSLGAVDEAHCTSGLDRVQRDHRFSVVVVAAAGDCLGRRDGMSRGVEGGWHLTSGVNSEVNSRDATLRSRRSGRGWDWTRKSDVHSRDASSTRDSGSDRGGKSNVNSRNATLRSRDSARTWHNERRQRDLDSGQSGGRLALSHSDSHSS